MTWEMSGRWIEMCSCRIYCPCNLGPAEPDQGWCSVALAFDMERGRSDGVDLGGAKMVLSAELPGDFMGGMDLARLYLDESLSGDQRREIEAIFMGKKGGVWEPMSAAIKQWLPAKVAKIELHAGDEPSFKVGDFGHGKLQRLKTPDGKQAVVVNAPTLSPAFEVDTQELGLAEGRWNDPDMRQWESWGNGAVVPFSWKV